MFGGSGNTKLLELVTKCDFADAARWLKRNDVPRRRIITTLSSSRSTANMECSAASGVALKWSKDLKNQGTYGAVGFRGAVERKGVNVTSVIKQRFEVRMIYNIEQTRHKCA